jgi:hypothetical protein
MVFGKRMVVLREGIKDKGVKNFQNRKKSAIFFD